MSRRWTLAEVSICSGERRCVLRADLEKGLLEKHASLQSPSRIEELVKVFIHATKVSVFDWGAETFSLFFFLRT